MQATVPVWACCSAIWFACESGGSACTLQSCEATPLMRKGAQWSRTNSNTPAADRSSRNACKRHACSKI